MEFARPGGALGPALAICRDAPTLGVQVRAGVHTGEIERREVVVSRTVADLLGSADHELHDRDEHELKGVPGRWQLFTAAD